MFVVPAPDLLVRDPATRALVPETGQEVDLKDAFWARALRDGDVLAPAPVDHPAEAAADTEESGS